MDRYADADPEEFVTVVGVGLMTLRSAVKGYVAAREKAAGTSGVLLTMVAREAGKEPSSFDPADLDRLAGMERFRQPGLPDRRADIVGTYVSRCAQEASAREDKRGVSNGEQYLMMTGAALRHPVTRVWKGYWQRAAA